jgi:hypothetical protein
MPRGRKIDVVVPDGIVRQNFQPSGRMNGLGVDAVSEGYDRRVGLAESFTKCRGGGQDIVRILLHLEPLPHNGHDRIGEET